MEAVPIAKVTHDGDVTAQLNPGRTGSRDDQELMTQPAVADTDQQHVPATAPDTHLNCLLQLDQLPNDLGASLHLSCCTQLLHVVLDGSQFVPKGDVTGNAEVRCMWW